MNPCRPNPIRTERALPIIALAGCGYFTLFFLYSVFANYWPGPFVDYWIDIPNVEKFFNDQLTFHDLISAHANVHRLVIPRLLFIADYRFFAGTNVLLIWVSIACKITTLLLFNYIIRNESPRSRLLINVLLFAAILNAANLSNVLHNSNMQWDLASVFACLAIYFYSRDITISAGSIHRLQSILLAWFFFGCGFLSQAGTLPVLLVFVFLSLLNRKWLESAVSILLMILVLYLTFAVLPVNEPEKPTYESAVAMMVFKLKYVAIYVFKMFSGSIYPLDNHLFIFSWIILAAFVLSLVYARKTTAAHNNVFLAIALFAFLMMITIAAARVDFSPGTWAANRYQTNVMLFILALSLHGYFSVSGKTIKNTIVVFSLTSFIITQYFLHNYAVIFGNKIFDTQSYMLTHGATQDNGANLLPSLQQYDRIASTDPLFRERGFAWYANKQGGKDFYRISKKTGETFLAETDKKSFFKSCPQHTASATYTPVEGGQGFGFSGSFGAKQFLFPSATLSRNTYYVLDNTGTVIGFSYWFINPDYFFSKVEIKGYVTAKSAHAIAEVSRTGTPVCLYTL